MAHAHAKPEHDYHLLEPSPWPILTSASVFALAVGLVLSMKGIDVAGMKLGPYVLGAAIIALIYCMASWWADVIREAEHEGHHTRVVQLHHRYGMLMFIGSEVMFFVAWFWAYFDAALFPAEAVQFTRLEVTGGQWPPKGIETLDPWHLPLLNTLILLTSGTTLTWAHHAMLENDRAGVKQGLWLTIALGALFSLVQAYEYTHAHFDFTGNIYGSTFVMATGFHGFHVIVGAIFLAVILARVYRNHFTPHQHLGFEFAAWYWHFVDVVWLFLFVSIYVWGSNIRYFH
ncbi:cytochrome c oxidase subunit 3 [Camelimonas abortus]|uniref:cytochrome-c oxidase n=1 Tax=Camelimonas abortus TaxID=1017184 RepID=A0ABV7LE80_9HYPH